MNVLLSVRYVLCTHLILDDTHYLNTNPTWNFSPVLKYARLYEIYKEICWPLHCPSVSEFGVGCGDSPSTTTIPVPQECISCKTFSVFSNVFIQVVIVLCLSWMWMMTVARLTTGLMVIIYHILWWQVWFMGVSSPFLHKLSKMNGSEINWKVNVNSEWF